MGDPNTDNTQGGGDQRQDDIHSDGDDTLPGTGDDKLGGGSNDKLGTGDDRLEKEGDGSEGFGNP